MTNLITTVLQNNSTCNKETLQKKKKVEFGERRQKSEVGKLSYVNWENNSPLPVHCPLGHHGD